MYVRAIIVPKYVQVELNPKKNGKTMKVDSFSSMQVTVKMSTTDQNKFGKGL